MGELRARREILNAVAPVCAPPRTPDPAGALHPRPRQGLPRPDPMVQGGVLEGWLDQNPNPRSKGGVLGV